MTTGWSFLCGTNGRHELVHQYVVGYSPASTGVHYFEDIYFER